MHAEAQVGRQSLDTVLALLICRMYLCFEQDVMSANVGWATLALQNPSAPSLITGVSRTKRSKVSHACCYVSYYGCQAPFLHTQHSARLPHFCTRSSQGVIERSAHPPTMFW